MLLNQTGLGFFFNVLKSQDNKFSLLTMQQALGSYYETHEAKN